MGKEEELIGRLTNGIQRGKEITQILEKKQDKPCSIIEKIMEKRDKRMETILEEPCNETKSEKMADLEARLYENTLVKRNKRVPSKEELDTLQEKFEKKLDDKKEDLLKRKNRIQQNLQVEKGLLYENGQYHVNVETEPDKVTYQEKEYEMVNHPKHYNNYDVEVVDMMERIWGTKATMEWCKMTAYKYRMRMGTKPGKDETKESMEAKLLEDFEKEQWYLDKAAELKEKIFNVSIDMNQ